MGAGLLEVAGPKSTFGENVLETTFVSAIKLTFFADVVYCLTYELTATTEVQVSFGSPR
jgi:hypothetical protein